MQNTWNLPLQEICDEFGLGKQILEIKSVPGFFLDKCWYLKTEKNQYALKQVDLSYQTVLTPDLMSIQRSQEIALKMQLNAIPTVVACLSKHKEYLFDVQNSCFMVAPWVNGYHLSNEEISLSMTKEIGQILGRMHCVHLKESDLCEPRWFGNSKEYWHYLLNASVASNKSLIAKIDPALLTLWSDLATYALPELNQQLVLSHRDLNLNNVIWQKNKPILLDWKCAGLINPQLDLFIVCLNFSGVGKGTLNWQKFTAVMLGYETVRPAIEITEKLVFGYYGYCLSWLEVNLKRLCSKPDNDIAMNEVLTTYHVLQWVTQEFKKKL